MKKKYLLYAVLPACALALAGAGATYAATTNDAHPHPFINKISEAIANKFNLNASDVQAVIDETVTTERAQMGQNRPEPGKMLAQAVTNGKLTQTQADMITAKREEMRASMENNKELTPAERTALMQAHREELKQWASDNNIPEEYILSPLGHQWAKGQQKRLTNK